MVLLGFEPKDAEWKVPPYTTLSISIVVTSVTRWLLYLATYNNENLPNLATQLSKSRSSGSSRNKDQKNKAKQENPASRMDHYSTQERGSRLLLNDAAADSDAIFAQNWAKVRPPHFVRFDFYKFRCI